MDEPFFQAQIQRLKNQWPHSYAKERTSRIWLAFKKSSNHFFSEVVDYALDTCRSSPLVEDLLGFENEVKKRNYRRDTVGDGSLLGLIQAAATQNRRADKEFVTRCTDLVKSYLNGSLQQSQFRQGCDYLTEVAELINPSKNLKNTALSTSPEASTVKPQGLISQFLIAPALEASMTDSPEPY